MVSFFIIGRTSIRVLYSWLLKTGESELSAQAAAGGIHVAGYLKDRTAGGIHVAGYLKDRTAGGIHVAGYLKDRTAGGIHVSGHLKDRTNFELSCSLDQRTKRRIQFRHRSRDDK
jgi:hypothetical protein